MKKSIILIASCVVMTLTGLASCRSNMQYAELPSVRKSFPISEYDSVSVELIPDSCEVVVAKEPVSLRNRINNMTDREFTMLLYQTTLFFVIFFAVLFWIAEMRKGDNKKEGNKKPEKK